MVSSLETSVYSIAMRAVCTLSGGDQDEHSDKVEVTYEHFISCGRLFHARATYTKLDRA